MLQTVPSFSIYNNPDGVEGEEKIDREIERNGIKLGGRVGSGGFSFGKSASSMPTGLREIEERDEGQEEGVREIEERDEDEEEGVREIGDVGMDPSVYLGTGLGFGGSFVPPSFDDLAGAEEYYRRMVNENPTSALFLGNYARILESKGDLEGAEEYYFRASFIDPNDGEILMLYAKLVWQLHRDGDRAQDYFERAVQLSPQDSDVLAAYARFLWEIEGEKEDDFQENGRNKLEEDKTYVPGEGIDVGTSGGNTMEAANSEEYYKRMVDENPESSISLRHYAQFLYNTKGDLIAAEDMFERAIHIDPTDGETKSEYAKLIWEIHHDQRRASCYFEQAVLAFPDDSNILAAYARFLWEAEEEEEEDDALTPNSA